MNTDTIFPPITEFPSMPMVQKYKRTPIAHHDTYYLYEPIEEPAKHLDLIQALHDATENDVINIRICCYGGQIDTMIAIIHAIMACEGAVVGHLDGEAYSAAVPIFLACDYHSVSKYSSLMMHDASTGSFGKVNEGKIYYDYLTDKIARICRDLLIKIFTEEEIEHILGGTDIYLQADELLVRLQKYHDKQEKELEEIEENV